MIIFKTGTWRHKATTMFVYDRIYWNGIKPLPLCKVRLRYVG